MQQGEAAALGERLIAACAAGDSQSVLALLLLEADVNFRSAAVSR
jgi:hypothetical protein